MIDEAKKNEKDVVSYIALVEKSAILHRYERGANYRYGDEPISFDDLLKEVNLESYNEQKKARLELKKEIEAKVKELEALKKEADVQAKKQAKKDKNPFRRIFGS